MVLPTVGRAQVAASLVSADASIQPGKPFTVALRFVHQPTWHTYWINPGTGLATTLKWKLPEGWKAGDIQWPAPTLLVDSRGNTVGNGYEGDLLLPVTITPPADLKPGTTVDLPVAADWLMCQDVCVPRQQEADAVAPGACGGPEARSRVGRQDPGNRRPASRRGSRLVRHGLARHERGHARDPARRRRGSLGPRGGRPPFLLHGRHRGL